MTVSSEQSDVSYSGDGVTIDFPVPFYFLLASDLRVSEVNQDGTETLLVLNTDYTVSGAGNQAGGFVSLLGNPTGVGKNLIIDRDPPATQDTAYQANDPFPAEEHEKALDKLTMLVQRLRRTFFNAIHFPLSDSTDGTLPKKSERAGMMLGFDALGQPIMLPITSSAGAGDRTPFSFVVGTDFNPGDTQLLLPRAPGSSGNLEVNFDASPQDFTQWQIVDSHLNFTSPIPEGVTRIWGYIGTTLSIEIPPDGSVTSNKLADDSVLDRHVSPQSALYNRVNDVIHARDFGARFDGLTDDTIALQAALNALASGKELIFPAGVTITGPLKPPILPGGGTGYRVRGAGVGNTIFREKTPDAGIFTAPSGIVFGAEFSGFSLQAHASANGGGCGFLISGYENSKFEKIGYLSNGAGYWANLFKLSASPELAYGNTIDGVHIFGQVGPSVPISFDNNGAGVNYNANACRIVGGIIANNTRVATCIDATKSINTVIDRVWLESNFLSATITGNQADASTGINSGEGTLIIGNYLERLSPYINYPNLVDGTSNNGLVTGNTFSPTWTTTTTFFNGAKNNLWVGNNEGGLPIQFVGAGESNRKIGVTLTKAQAIAQAPTISFASGVGGTPSVSATVNDVDLNGDITYEIGLGWITSSGGANLASTFSLGAISGYELKSLFVTANMPTTNNCPVPCSAAASSAVFSVAIPAATTYGIQVKAIFKKAW